MSHSTITQNSLASTVVGDGTTAGSRIKSRAKRARPWVIMLVGVVVLALAMILIRPSGNKIPLHPDNHHEDGSMALANVLKDQGVGLTVTHSPEEAAAKADEDTTVFFLDAWFVEESLYDEIHDSGANLVIAQPTEDTLSRLASSLTLDDQVHEPGGDDSNLVAAECSDPHAQAAAKISPSAPGFMLEQDDDQDLELCFVQNDMGAFAATDDGSIRFFADIAPFQNDELDSAGNAALTIRSLGEKPELLWVIPSFTDSGVESSGDQGPSLFDFLPPWFGGAMLLSLLVAVVAAFWRGRRMGPLMVEPLPVEVHSTETTIGLGHLYRRGSSLVHAGQALRSGAALRCAQRLGLAASTPNSALAAAVAHATSRDYESVFALLFGSAPANESDLLHLAHSLDSLESEVAAS